MTMWPTVPLRRWVRCLDGQRVPLNSEQRSGMIGEYPYWGANGIVDHVDSFLFDETLILLGEDGAPFGDPTRNVAFLVASRVWVNNHIHVLRPYEGVDPRFLVYALNTFDWMPLISGSTRDKLTQEDMLGAAISKPPPTRQRLIADYLDVETTRIDALIDKKRRMIRLLEERRMSVMTDGVRGRFTASSGVKSGLRWLDERPADWSEVKLTLVARLGSGHTPSRDHPEWWTDCTIPWITTGEVSQMRSDRIEFICETRERISALGIANSSAEIHPSETVVLCRTASAGYSAIMGADMATSQDFAVWTCGPLVRPRFLLLCLRAMRRDLLGRLAMGSTHKTIYMPDIEGLRIPLPATDEQDRIVEAVWFRLRQIDAVREMFEQQLHLLVEHRQALIAAAVIGEMDVPEVAA